MLNIHPSLLPDLRGLHTHERALAAGLKEHGCTVHFVEPELDAGPIVAQARVPVLPGDDAERLAARVLVEEHKLYPRALAEVAARLSRRAQTVARCRDASAARARRRLAAKRFCHRITRWMERAPADRSEAGRGDPPGRASGGRRG